MVTRAWKVYGTEGHRQRESFFPSYQYDFSNEQNGTRIIDKTGTHDYSIVRITRDTAKLCAAELNGQISDGIFENSRVGQILEVLP